jgi:hypothetical protein
MNDSATTPGPADASLGTDASGDPSATSEGAGRRIRWPLIGLIAGGTLLLILIGGVGVRALVAALPPGIGSTAVGDLRPGSCLKEADAGLPTYTVVPCFFDHGQQFIAPVDLSVSGNVFTQFSVMTTYTQAVCDRFLEYGLFIAPEVASAANRSNYAMHAFYVPSEAEFKSGTVMAGCSISRADGTASSSDLFKAAP